MCKRQLLLHVPHNMHAMLLNIFHIEQKSTNIFKMWFCIMQWLSPSQLLNPVHGAAQVVQLCLCAKPCV